MVSRIKQHTRFYPFLTILTLVAFVWVFTIVAPQEAVAATISGGTIVQVSPNTTLSSENLAVGDAVQLSVMSDVKVDGTVVIAAGAPARGEVTSLQKKGMVGRPGKITITIKSVQAVDGKMIAVAGSKSAEGDDQMTTAIVVSVLLCLLGVLIQGGEATISSGTPIECNVVAQTDVNA